MSHLILLLVFLLKLFLCDRRIANGDFVRDFEYPHLVSVFLVSGNHHFCAGGLINSKSVLLAAHCFDHHNAREMGVSVGTNDVRSSNNFRKIRVKDAKLHPLWDKAKYDEKGKLVNDYDVAIITLEEEIAETENIRYMDIEDVGDIDLPKPGTMVDVAGWGYMYDKSRNRDYLARRIIVPVNEASKCKSCKDDIMVCAGDGKGHDSCNGDSGTAILRLRDGAASKRWTASGVLSFGPAGCGRMGAIGVYTRLRVFSDWIWSVVEKPPQPSEDIGTLPYIFERFHNFSCFGIPSSDEKSCNSGSCISVDKCICPEGYFGDKCENKKHGINEPEENKGDIGTLNDSYVPYFIIPIFLFLFVFCQATAMIVLVFGCSLKNDIKELNNSKFNFQYVEESDSVTSDSILDEYEYLKRKEEETNKELQEINI